VGGRGLKALPEMLDFPLPLTPSRQGRGDKQGASFLVPPGEGDKQGASFPEIALGWGTFIGSSNQIKDAVAGESISLAGAGILRGYR